MNTRQQSANILRKKQSETLWTERRDEIKWLYYDLEMSQSEIGEYYGVSQATIKNSMKRLGLKARGKGNIGPKNGRYINGKQSRLYRNMITKDKCAICGTTENLGIHHKNNDHYDNRLENLQILCNSCHMSETKRAWWDAKKAGVATPKSNGLVGWNKK